MITVPVYQIVCDEEGCGRIDAFPLSSTDIPDVYAIQESSEVYAHFGGETLSDGKHRCAACKKKINPGDPNPKEIVDRVLRIHSSPDPLASVLAIVKHARVYREVEQDGTPRLWRGKHLTDLALKLDEALETYP